MRRNTNKKVPKENSSAIIVSIYKKTRKESIIVCTQNIIFIWQNLEREYKKVSRKERNRVKNITEIANGDVYR